MLINFYEEAMLQNGKDLIDAALAEHTTSQYATNFRLVRFDKPDQNLYAQSEYQGALTRYKRRVLTYRALLNKAGFQLPAGLRPATTGLFSTELLTAMSGFEAKDKKDKDKEQPIKTAAAALSNVALSWDALATAFEGLWYFLKTSAYADFNTDYIKRSTSGEGWADSDLERLLEMFAFPKTTNLLGLVKDRHAVTASGDYADAIYQDLADGKLVIVDQSSGEPELNKSAADRIMWRVFSANQALFRDGQPQPEVLVYVEEAHNLLPEGSNLDLKDVWVRTAKEGGKYHIGLVYATQEVSSIQMNILKNTANWLIGHLNNTDETKVLTRFYDFDDFAESIIRAQDRGFLRVKTLSNLFTIPVQVLKFEV